MAITDQTFIGIALIACAVWIAVPAPWRGAARIVAAVAIGVAGIALLV